MLLNSIQDLGKQKKSTNTRKCISEIPMMQGCKYLFLLGIEPGTFFVKTNGVRPLDKIKLSNFFHADTVSVILLFLNR